MARTNTNSGGGGGGSVNSVTASAPLTSSGGANPNIALTMPVADRIWYSNNAGSLTSDPQFTRDATTLETLVERDFDSIKLTYEIEATDIMSLSSVTGTYQVGETITGGTSGATAVIDYVGLDDFLIISSVVGTFQAGETITGGTSGATGTMPQLIENNFQVGDTFVVLDIDNTTFLGQGEILAIVAGGYSITMNSGTISAGNGISVGNAPIAAGVLTVTPTAPIITAVTSGMYSQDSINGSGFAGTAFQQSSSQGIATVGVIDASSFGGYTTTGAMIAGDGAGTSTQFFVSPIAGAMLADNAAGDSSIMLMQAGLWTVNASLSSTGNDVYGFQTDGTMVAWIGNDRTFILPDSTPSLGEVLTVGNISGQEITLIFDAPTAGTPGGANGAVQFNDSGSFGGASVLSYSEADDYLTSTLVNGLYMTAGQDQFQYGYYSNATNGNYARFLTTPISQFDIIGNVAGTNRRKIVVTNGITTDNHVILGSGNETGVGAFMDILDVTGEINNNVDNFYRITDLQTSTDWFKLDIASGFIAMGVVNNNSITVDNSVNNQVTIESQNYLNYRNTDGLWMQIDVIAGQERVRFGDLSGAANGSTLVLDDFNQRFTVTLGGVAPYIDIDPPTSIRFGGADTNDGNITFDNTANTSLWAVQVGQSNPTGIALSGTGTAGTITYTGARIETSIRDLVYNASHGLNIGDYILRFTSGTGAATVDLSSQAFPAGHLLIIKDYDCIAGTSNITVDAGTGNIISGTSQAQTFVMNTNGQCIYIRAVGSGDWQIEAII